MHVFCNAEYLMLSLCCSLDLLGTRFCSEPAGWEQERELVWGVLGGGDTSPPGGISSPGLGTQDGVADRDQMLRFRGLVGVFASAVGNWYSCLFCQFSSASF